MYFTAESTQSAHFGYLSLTVPLQVANRYSNGGSRISGKGINMHKSEGVRLADLSQFSEISNEKEII